MSFLAYPNLPASRVKCVAVNGCYENLNEIENLGINIVKIPPNKSLSAPVCAHADMNICHLGGNEVLVAKEQGTVFNKLANLGFSPRYITKTLERNYPDDVALNCALIGDFAVANFDSVADEIKDFCKINLKTVDVKQGYSKCSVLVVGKNAVITADEPIAAALEQKGFDVLKIRSGNIKLSGYDYGFIGGCGGLIDSNTLLFCGDITSHPDYAVIHKFLTEHKVAPLCLSGELTDVGGILPLLQ